MPSYDNTVGSFTKMMEDQIIQEATEASAARDTLGEAGILRPKDYQLALDVQHASNLSGVTRSFNKLIPRIWGEADKRNKGTYWVNRHPISVLLVARMSWLSAGGRPNFETWRRANRDCERGAAGEELEYNKEEDSGD